MTARELLAYLQAPHALLSTGGGLHVPVTVLDARQVFDRVDLLVEPHGDLGHGQTWVRSDRVTFPEGGPA